jgi:hypothetical protein
MGLIQVSDRDIGWAYGFESGGVVILFVWASHCQTV